MKYFIADNEPSQVASISDLLEAMDRGCSIWPPSPQALTTWAEVETALLHETRDNEDLVVLLDLSLEQHLAFVSAGVERGLQLRRLRPSAVFLAFTQFGPAAEVDPRFEETFDGLIDKQRLHNLTTQEQVTYVKQIVSAATRKRRRLSPRYTLRDSIGLRLASVALSDEAFDYLVEEVAPDWTDVQVAALSSGHSGAFLLAISGIREGSQQRIIVKCARDIRVIRNETIAVEKHLAELGPLGEVMAQYGKGIHTLPDTRGYFYKQAEVLGETLLQKLSKLPWSNTAKNLLDTILSLEVRCYTGQQAGLFGRAHAENKFPLTPIDVGRAEQSLHFLGDASAQTERLGQWPTSIPSSSQVRDEVCHLLTTWAANLQRLGELFVVGQHGDLNLGNVIVPDSGNIVLIDFSRLGSWPIGYDIARLAMMCRIYLTDSKNASDWVDNNLRTWTLQQFCSIDSAVDLDSVASPWGLYCDQRFRAFMADAKADERPLLALGYQVGTLWDLLKMLSYSDLSVFKRIWALIVCWQLGKKLAFI